MTPYELAQAEIGTVEWQKGANPKVLAYYKDAGHPEISDDATAWCAAFVGAMIKRAGGVPTGSLMARSYLKWGDPVDLKDARPGDVVVFSRGKDPVQGHVAFFVQDNGSTITVLGGNQADAVNRRAFPKANMLSIRRAKQPAATPIPVLPVPAPAKPTTGLLAAFLAALAGILKPKG